MLKDFSQNTTWLRVLFLGACAFMLASCAKPKAQEPCGFVQNVYGERVSWKKDIPIRMYMHTSIPAHYEASIRAAAATWNRAYGRDIIFIEDRRVGGTVPARDSANVIYKMSTWEADRSSEQARTSLYWVGDQIQEADIRLNAFNYQFYTGQESTGALNSVSLEALVLHEMGHVLGLRHNDEEPSVMATYLKTQTNRTQLQAADTSSLKCEY